MTTTDPTVRLARRIAADAATLPRAVEAWIAAVRLATADGYPAGTSSSGPRPVNHISDPTGDQAAHNTTGTGTGYGPSDEHALVLGHLRAMTDSIEIVLRFVAKRDVHHGDTPTCTGGHLQGAHIPRSEGGWHDATCDQPAELYRRDDGGYGLRYEGLCQACARRRQRSAQRADVVAATTRPTCGDA